ncbi:LysR family transcriptional regulator [Nitratireductor sp. ZSWI3]|uniref:LysR family transcriptional regulator n=1 Tax=Nitratireductor sp. ZSWI3 TaxID=2966359 RepID=UPI00214FDD61|nr:LysR family transcriptional regulator [Nitratireductor sp. ZSWI3]MCR4267217.1 LysR family transcriptional regulator [Nitratireductor sp. ZSWI3]
MQLRFLETFVHLAKVRNFRKAADLLHTSQPVISSRINALENELGAKLFERSKRSVQLTSEGRMLLPHAELVIELTNEMKWLVGPGSRLTGSLRVGVTDTILRSWFVRLMEAFREKYPNVNIEMLSSTSAEIIQSLRDHGVDVGLAMMDGTDPKLNFVPLGAFPVAWVASPTAFPIRRAALDTLLDMPILTFPKNSIPYKTLERYLKACSKVRANVHSSNSIATIVKMAEEGLGVAPMPRAVVLRELASGSLHEIEVDVDFPPLEFYAICEASPHKSLKDEFVRMAQEQALAYAAEHPAQYLMPSD